MNSKLRINLKVRSWKETIQKLKDPEKRKKLSYEEAGTLTIYMQKIEEEIIHLQKKFNYKLKDYVNFQKLKKDFLENIKKKNKNNLYGL